MTNIKLIFFINKIKMCKYDASLLNLALESSEKRVEKINENNGYAYLSCSVLHPKKSYCVLQYWNESL